MRLLLTSNGISNQAIRRSLEELAGRTFCELSVVFIPTAANVEAGDKSWLIDDITAVCKLGWKSIDILEIGGLDNDQIERRLLECDVVVVGGGDSGYLSELIFSRGLNQVFTKFINDKVYVGISAGSMITGPYLENAISQKHFDEKLGKTFGVVDFLIKPHLNSEYFPERTVKEFRVKFEGIPNDCYALDDSSAVMVNGASVEVITQGDWCRFDGVKRA